MRPVLILGGYGNFGKRIARALTGEGLAVIIAGRSRDKAQNLCQTLPPSLATVAIFDVRKDLSAQLAQLRPCAVVNTCGPFQGADYTIARACIDQRVAYIDLADGRKFVTGIKELDGKAKANDTTVISGASTVPGLSSAVVEHFRAEFSQIDQMTFGISPGQQAERGLATTQGILSYVGKRLAPFVGDGGGAFGWQGIYRQAYPGLGKRWMGNCDIPDLDLLPPRYGIGAIRFGAGLELAPLHLGLWALGGLVRAGLPLNLARWAGALLWASNLFDRFGSSDGGMHVILTGRDGAGAPHQRRWFIVARGGDGPQIPTIPAILLAGDIARGRPVPIGAMACVGLVELERYVVALQAYDIEIFTDIT